MVMVRLNIHRRPTRGNYFVGYVLTVDIDGKQYDLNIDFLVWSHIKPNKKITFSLRPEATPGAFSGPGAPIYKREVLPGMFEEKWKEGVKDIKYCIDTTSFPLNPKDNHELFSYCFNDPVTFSFVYQERLKELQEYSNKNTQEIWSAPRWSEVDSKSIIRVEKVPSQADDFFLYVFKLRLESAGYEI